MLFVTNLNTVGNGAPVLTGPGIINKANAAQGRGAREARERARATDAAGRAEPAPSARLRRAPMANPDTTPPAAAQTSA